MTNSFNPGTTPLIGSQLSAYLTSKDDDSLVWGEDDLDRFIIKEELRISRFVFFRDLDLLLIILNNRRLISQRLSAYSFLQQATDEQLATYETSSSGIHWPMLDIDLSLRGFLMDELVGTLRVD